jgi:hypothetical protein
MPDIEYAFLADGASAVPGEKFSILGGGVNQISGPGFPLRHPHLALVVGLRVTAAETDREHDLRFVLLDPGGNQVAEAGAQVTAHGQAQGRDVVLTMAIDIWNLTFPAPGEYSFRLLVGGSERKQLPLIIGTTPEGPYVGSHAPGARPDRSYDA